MTRRARNARIGVSKPSPAKATGATRRTGRKQLSEAKAGEAGVATRAAAVSEHASRYERACDRNDGETVVARPVVAARARRRGPERLAGHWLARKAPSPHCGIRPARGNSDLPSLDRQLPHQLAQ